MPNYDKITTEEFDHALSSLLDDMMGAQIMAIPGVYEAVSEELNNNALDLALKLFHAHD